MTARTSPLLDWVASADRAQLEADGRTVVEFASLLRDVAAAPSVGVTTTSAP